MTFGRILGPFRFEKKGVLQQIPINSRGSLGNTSKTCTKINWKVDNFLDAFDQPKLNHEDINHLNRSITSNEIEAVIKSLPTKKAQDLMD
jgi:hypothetical protein